MANDLDQQIIKQLEYYFGDINLPRDKFLQEKLKEDDGWVTLEVLLTFKRLAALSTDTEVIAKAAEKSENKIVEVSEDHKKIRRHPDNPVPELTAERRQILMDRTAYVKGFPLDEDLSKIIEFMEPHKVESCHRRTKKDHTFKGSCFIIFKDVEACKTFVELESLKYGEQELIRKFQKVYLDEKRAQFKKDKAALAQAKKDKAALADSQKQEQIDFPKGAVIHFTGLEEGQCLTREELKEKVKEVGELETQFIDFTKGDLQGYFRFPEANNAVDFFKKLTDGELEVSGYKLKLRVLEGQEEEEYLKKSSDAIHELRKKQKQGGKFRKRKFNHSHGGKNAKSKKTE
ncbi:unnamed protein product [Phyllotreta striolata]|uniref:Uncharacterized protein n=1 Tax=Phyllotreta striolata TaxID=444603 RepID=A0A9N9TBH3_PHYSR|nr:unnamed protein product [Phyllotreta striolata]